MAAFFPDGTILFFANYFVMLLKEQVGGYWVLGIKLGIVYVRSTPYSVSLWSSRLLYVIYCDGLSYLLS